MKYADAVRELASDPERMELSYQEAFRTGAADAFAEAIEATYAETPSNLLLAAWHFRLLHAARKARDRVIAWRWALPLALLNGLLLWAVSDDAHAIRVDGGSETPLLAMVAVPASACFGVLFLCLAGERAWPRAVGLVAGLVGATVYVLLVHPRVAPRVFEEQYVTLAALHLVAVSWAALGAFVLGPRRDPGNRFAFLVKSLETVIVAGLLAGAGAVFLGVTLGLFEAIDVELPESVLRLLAAGGAGLIPVLALSIAYDPRAEPADQPFDEGLSKTIAMVVRLLLPLTLAVGLVYLGFIALNFRAPFQNRDVLVIYNAMLFAVIALLVAATPVPRAVLAGLARRWLRPGIVAVAALALVVSLYALAAIAYRTVQDHLTPNRLAFIGWNVINVGILVLLLAGQARSRSEGWRPAAWRAFATGAVAYAGWALVVLAVTPWLFSRLPRGTEALPRSVRYLVEAQPAPILLKCEGSPHIYLLEDGTKRWVKDITTFEARGYVWDDVVHLDCATIEDVPVGAPIPTDAGTPPDGGTDP